MTHFYTFSRGIRLTIRDDWENWRGVDPPGSPIGLPFDGIDSYPDKREVRELLIASDYKKLPPNIDLLTQLREIQIPVTLAPSLFKHAIIGRLTKLSLLGDGKLKPIAPLPNITTLIGNGFLEFRTKDFIGLEHVELDTRNKSTLFSQLCSLPKLRMLAIRPVSKKFEIEELPLGLTHLQFQLGSIETLRSISKLEHLLDIRLRYLKRLRSIQELKDVPSLQTVHLLGCPQVDLESLLSLPNLKEVWLFSRKRDPVALELKARGVEIH